MRYLYKIDFLLEILIHEICNLSPVCVVNEGERCIYVGITWILWLMLTHFSSECLENVPLFIYRGKSNNNVFTWFLFFGFMYVRCSFNTSIMALSDVEFSSSSLNICLQLTSLCQVDLVLDVGSKVNAWSSFVVNKFGCRAFYLLTFLSFHITFSEFLLSPSWNIQR
jgi:hypothetical protein